MASVHEFVTQHGIAQGELAQALGVSGPAVSRKLAGVRGWKLGEVHRVLAFLSERLGRPVDFAEVFGESDVAEDGPDPASTEAAS